MWTPEAELHIPHENGEIKFAFPPFGPGEYRVVGQQILDAGLQVPNGGQMASLVHTAFCDPDMKDEPQFERIKHIIRGGDQNWLWMYLCNFVTKKGIYVFQDSEVRGGQLNLTQRDLEKMLKEGPEIKGIRFSEDIRVSFAPRGSYSLVLATSMLLEVILQKSLQEMGLLLRVAV